MKKYLKVFFTIALIIIIQVFILNRIQLWGLGSVFLYIICILAAPIDTKPSKLIVLGFLVGFVIDILFQSYGIHAFATTLTAYLRPYIIKLFNNKDDLEGTTRYFVEFSRTYYSYVILMVFIHVFCLFFLEAFTFKHILAVLLKTLTTTALTTVFVFITQAMFLKKYSER